MEPSANTQPQKPEAQPFIEEGDRLQSSGDFYGAIDTYSLAITKDPENALAYHKRGWAKAHTGDIKGEIEDWSKVIEINPQFDTAYADRAVARVALRDFKGAEKKQCLICTAVFRSTPMVFTIVLQETHSTF